MTTFLKVTDDAHLIKCVESFRRGLIGNEPSYRRCFMVCAPLVTLVEMWGFKGAGLYQSVVQFEDDGDTVEMDHVFIKLPDGRVLDPTGDQYNNYFPELKMPKVYLGPVREIHRRAVLCK